MTQRLLLMHDVARAKWNARKPLADNGRETIMLRVLAEKGRVLGMEPEFTYGFFAAQIEASRLLQADDIRRWKAERHGPFADAPDLNGDLRPRIDKLNDKLLACWSKSGRPCADAKISSSVWRRRRWRAQGSLPKFATRRSGRLLARQRKAKSSTGNSAVVCRQGQYLNGANWNFRTSDTEVWPSCPTLQTHQNICFECTPVRLSSVSGKRPGLEARLGIS